MWANGKPDDRTAEPPIGAYVHGPSLLRALGDAPIGAQKTINQETFARDEGGWKLAGVHDYQAPASIGLTPDDKAAWANDVAAQSARDAAPVQAAPLAPPLHETILPEHFTGPGNVNRATKTDRADLPPALTAQPAPLAASGPAYQDKLLNFLKAAEGYSANPYGDYKQTSIGYGSKALPGETYLSPADAEARKAQDVAAVDSWIKANVKTPLTENQRIALTSFGDNLGVGKGGLSDLLPGINSGNWQGVADQMGRYIHAGGQPNQGLISRRDNEISLLLKPDGEPTAWKSAPRAGGVPVGTPSTQSAAAQPATGADVRGGSSAGNREAAPQYTGALGLLNALGVPIPDTVGRVATSLNSMAPILGYAGANKLPAYYGEYQPTQARLGMEQTKLGPDIALTQAQTALAQAQMYKPEVISHVVGYDNDGRPITTYNYGSYNAADPTHPIPITTAGAQGVQPVAMQANLGEAPGTMVLGSGETVPVPPSLQGKVNLNNYLDRQAVAAISGREPMPVISKGNTQAMAVQNRIRELDPTYNSARHKYYENWVNPNGNTGKLRTAFNAAIEHGSGAYDLNEAHGYTSNLGPLSSASTAGQKWYAASSNEPWLNAYASASKEFAQQAANVGAGSAGSALTDREEILSSLDPAKGKDAVRAAIRQWTMIMDGKARALANDAKKNMGPFGGTLSVLDEDNIARHDKIAGAQNPAQQGKGAPKDASQPAPATLAGKPTGANGKTEDRLGTTPVPAQESQPQPSPYREGQTASGKNGERIIFRNGNWGAAQ